MSYPISESELHGGGTVPYGLDVSVAPLPTSVWEQNRSDSYCLFTTDLYLRWGCPPGWLCKPILDHCNFEAGLPDRNFLCSPNECIPAEALPAILPTWDATIYGNSTPDTNPALGISAIDSFFNMNPLQFGLTYEIFSFSEVFTYTTTILLPPSPTMAARQAQTSIPGACYPWCNNCLLEAQSNGKTSALCVPGSAFEVSLNQCEQCIIYHKNDDTASFVQLAPQFQQFLDYCEQFSTIVISTTVTATTTNTVGSTYSIVTGTIATTVTPKSPTAASSLSTTQSRPTSVVTVVASTATVTTISATSTTARSPNSTTIATPPAPVSSQQPYTTTSTGVTTSYSHTTISGSAWNSITIIMPVGNSTTTIYGSTMSYENATLVLPTSPTTISYTTTMTITPGTQVSAQATTTTVKPSGSAATISPATFNSSASALRFSPRADGLQLTTLTLVLLTIAMLML